MQVFERVTSIVTPLTMQNVDTDMIIPKQFLATLSRDGLGSGLFYELRFALSGTFNASFPLNNPRFAGSSILLARDNFGCGSSREHAVWALLDYGFKAVIAPSFADIFFNNCFNNGLLPAILPGDAIDHLFVLSTHTPLTVTIDLESQTVRIKDQMDYFFEIDPVRKCKLLEGLDDIDQTLSLADSISRFENHAPHMGRA